MKVIWIRREPPDSSALARLNLQLPGGIRLFGLRLRRKADRYTVHAPNAGGTSVVTFPPSAVEEIAKAAVAEMERMPNVKH